MLNVLLITLVGLGCADSRAEQAPSDVPEWAIQEMASMVGMWRTSNAAYVSDDEPYDRYGMTWTWDAGKSSVSGLLFGLEPGKVPVTFWTFHLFWHPGEQELLLAQHGRDGTYGVGPVRRTGEDERETLQVFYPPDGTTFRVGHRTRLSGPERHDATFRVTGDHWEPQRTYVWLRHAPATASDQGTTESGSATEDADWKALYDRGVSYRTFLDAAVKRRAMWRANTERARVPSDLLARARRIGGTWRLLVVAEDACSDSANILPYLGRLVDEVEGLEMRIVRSKPGRDVMEAHRTSDNRPATPTILVLDDAYRKAGCLVERPPDLQAWALEAKARLPSSEYMKQKFERYDADAGRSSMRAIVETIARRTTDRPRQRFWSWTMRTAKRDASWSGRPTCRHGRWKRRRACRPPNT